MWCVGCKKETICRVIPSLPDGRQPGQRKKASVDICWFERRRKCKACGEEFETAEINYNLLVELWKLRDAMREIAANAGKAEKTIVVIKEHAEALVRWQEEK